MADQASAKMYEDAKEFIAGLMVIQRTMVEVLHDASVIPKNVWRGMLEPGIADAPPDDMQATAIRIFLDSLDEELGGPPQVG